jgi:hypothetical protein
MNLILAGYEIDFEVTESDSIISKQTGHELEHLHVNAAIEGEEVNEKVADYLKASWEEGLNSKEGQITKKWKVINNSCSYGGNKDLVNYSLELEEMEEIKLDKLMLNDLELTPYRYREDIGLDDSLSAEGRVLLSESQFDVFKKLIDKDITIIRKGISETPRQMDLALSGWSKDETGIKLQFSLYDSKDDENELSWSRPIWSAVDLIIKQGQIIEQLANLLIQKDIIKKGEFESIKAGIPERNWNRKLDLYKEKDLDDWKF